MSSTHFTSRVRVHSALAETKAAREATPITIDLNIYVYNPTTVHQFKQFFEAFRLCFLQKLHFNQELVVAIPWCHLCKNLWFFCFSIYTSFSKNKNIDCQLFSQSLNLEAVNSITFLSIKTILWKFKIQWWNLLIFDLYLVIIEILSNVELNCWFWVKKVSFL